MVHACGYSVFVGVTVPVFIFLFLPVILLQVFFLSEGKHHAFTETYEE